MKHVLVIVPFYPDENQPYAGRFFREHAEALTLHYRVSVLFADVPAFSQTRTLSTHIRETSENHGLFVVRSKAAALSQRFPFWVERCRKSAFSAGYHAVVHKNGVPDFVLAETGFPSAALAFQLFKSTGIPFGIIDHYSFSSRMFSEHRKEWPKIYGAATFRAAVSPALQRVVRASTAFQFPVEILPNCLSPDLLLRPITKPPEMHGFRWIFIGRDHPVKQPDLLFEAFSRLPNHHELTVVGLEKTAGFLAKLPDEVRARIRILPGMPAEPLWTEMERHHALVCTSSIETFGMAPLEMLALGRAVVTTPCGGPEVFTATSSGIVASGFEPEVISGAMQQLADRFSTFNLQKSASSLRLIYSAAQFERTFSDLTTLRV